ncbi:MAG: aminopeptidase [Clostridiales bacterium]|nr:aminopeptidase [Clostridiales bacterium]MBR3843114.1 aminopeptidase [Christensenellaceae bacterium]
MADQRITQLAENLMTYSCALKPGEKVLIEVYDCDDFVAEELVRAAYKVGAVPHLEIRRYRPFAALVDGLSKEQAEDMARYDAARMNEMDAYIGIRGYDNASEMSGASKQGIEYYQSIYSHMVHGTIRVKKTKWCVLRYPTPSMAQLAGMSTRDFEDFYFNVCNLDYSKMSVAMDSLVEMMEKTDKVRLTAKDTDITFSIKGMKAIKCDGKMNIPDGEVYTAPIRDSINGRITYNTPSEYSGTGFDNISFLFKDGKIIEATANNTEALNRVLDTDEGARYIGEFAIGVNPFVTKPMNDTLFDEKISGSIHFTPGAAYDDAYNGNDSAIHWDLVLIQTPEYGGGDMWFDDVKVRENGRFIVPELECLNPENLM